MQDTQFSELHKYVAADAVVDWQTEDIPQSPVAMQVYITAMT